MSTPKTIPLPSSLHSAINATMQAVGYVQKTGKATFGEKYSYASDADLLAGLRPAMVANGLTLVPERVERTDSEHFPTAKGNRQTRCDVLVTFRLTHAPSDQSLTIQAIGTGIDSGDKAPYKAMTGALKYALRQGFLIETGNDPEQDPPGHEQDPPPKTEQQSRRARQEAPPDEDPGPYLPPQDADSDRWSHQQQKAFCAALADEGIKYVDFAAATEAAGKGRPSAWSQTGRDKVIDQLHTKAGGAWDAWQDYWQHDPHNSPGHEPGEE